MMKLFNEIKLTWWVPNHVFLKYQKDSKRG